MHPFNVCLIPKFAMSLALCVFLIRHNKSHCSTHCFCMLVINCQLVHICSSLTHTHDIREAPAIDNERLIYCRTHPHFQCFSFAVNRNKLKIHLINRNLEFFSLSERKCVCTWFFSSTYVCHFFSCTFWLLTRFSYRLRFNGQVNASTYVVDRVGGNIWKSGQTLNKVNTHEKKTQNPEIKIKSVSPLNENPVQRKQAFKSIDGFIVCTSFVCVCVFVLFFSFSIFLCSQTNCQCHFPLERYSFYFYVYFDARALSIVNEPNSWPKWFSHRSLQNCRTIFVSTTVRLRW